MSKTSTRYTTGMERDALLKVVDVFIEQGIPLENFRRDLEIRHKFYSAIEENPKIERRELKQSLANEYFLDYKTIEGIVYARKPRSEDTE